MHCNEVMSRVPVFLRTEQSIAEVAEVMRDENVGFLPVCDAEGKVLGAVTDRDVVVRIVASRRSLDTPVRDIMSADVVSCQQDDDLSRAEELMESHQISRIMCVDAKGVLVGVIGVADLVAKDEKHVPEVVHQVKSDHASASH